MNEAEILSLRLRLPGTAEHLSEAFTHRSYAVEHDLAYDNQRLEFLGDAVLEIIQTEFLFRHLPDAPEGQLTKLRSALACESALAKWARQLDLGRWLLVGRGEGDNGGAARCSTLADLFEAVLGAIYLDLGFDAARDFVRPLLEEHIADPGELLSALNPKGQLQELSQRIYGRTPLYSILCVRGPQHLPHYDVEVRVAEYVAVGSGNSRKQAESEAAAQLCRYLSEACSDK